MTATSFISPIGNGHNQNTATHSGTIGAVHGLEDDAALYAKVIDRLHAPSVVMGYEEALERASDTPVQ